MRSPTTLMSLALDQGKYWVGGLKDTQPPIVSHEAPKLTFRLSKYHELHNNDVLRETAFPEYKTIQLYPFESPKPTPRIKRIYFTSNCIHFINIGAIILYSARPCVLGAQHQPLVKQLAFGLSRREYERNKETT